MRSPLPGTKVRRRGIRIPARRRIGADRRRSPRSLRGPRGGRVDRAQRSGASLNTATRGKPLRLEPRTCEDAWATGAPAPQRPHADTAGAKAPRRLRRAQVGPGFKDPSPKWSEAERGLGSEPATGAAPASATEWLRSHIYIYSTTHTQERPCPPDSVRGQGRECVWARAGARDIRLRGRLQEQISEVVHGIGVLKLDIHHTQIWE